MKKAQGVSINTIIVAAIALIVLVILLAIFYADLNGERNEVTKICENPGIVVDGELIDYFDPLDAHAWQISEEIQSDFYRFVKGELRSYIPGTNHSIQCKSVVEFCFNQENFTGCQEISIYFFTNKEAFDNWKAEQK